MITNAMPQTLEDIYLNGRYAGRLDDQIDELRIECVGSSAELKEEYRGRIQELREKLDSIPKPRDLAEFIAYQIGFIRS